ncbi:MAG: threonine-phosphate decarboxylase CobD [Hyphomicrobiales bacterium]
MDAASSGEDRRKGEVYHGGDLAAASLRFPDAPKPWLDLSTGINPVAYPVGELSADAWTRLPESAAICSLEAAAAAAYGLRDATLAVAAPGAQALIQWLPRLVPARRVGILGFTYAEHEACWRAAGASVSTVDGIEALEEADVAIVVNPNNPDGRFVPREELAALARRLARKGAVLVVDEAFMDAEPASRSLAPILPPTGAVVLRSFGKLYGLAGLRLGFAVASPPLAAAVRQALGPWAVSGAAIAIGRKALADTPWRERTIARLASDIARLDTLLGGAGLAIIGGTALFRLARHARAAPWFEHLGRAGILVRPFPARPDWLRFGLPGREADWRRLEAALVDHRPSATTR